MDRLSNKDKLLLNNILVFYRENNFKNFKKMLEYTTQKKKKIPLRYIEWFVMNYSKKYPVSYNILRTNGKVEYFSVNMSYMSQVDGIGKNEFDPYCRGNTIDLEYTDDNDNKNIIQTCYKQLKFFKWAIENKVLDYIEKHLEEIKQDIKQFDKKRRETSKTGSIGSFNSASTGTSASAETSASTITNESISTGSLGSKGSKKKKTEIYESAYNKFYVTEHKNLLLL